MNITQIRNYSLNFGKKFEFNKDKMKPSRNRLHERRYTQQQLLSQTYDTDNLKSLCTLEDYLDIYSKYWFIKNCFHPTYVEKQGKSTEDIVLIDTADELNSENLTRLDSTSSLMGKLDFAKLYRLTNQEINRLTNYGYLIPFKLKNQDGFDTSICLYDMSLPSNVATLHKLTARSSVEHKKLVQSDDKPVLVTPERLAQFGFGTPKRLIELINSGTIKGTNEAGHTVQVNLNNSHNEKILQHLREQRCVDENKIYEIFSISGNDYYKAIFDGNIDALESVFIGDIDKMRTDYKNQKNRTFINKLAILSLAYQKIIYGKDKINQSRVIEILSAIYPEAIDTAIELANDNTELLSAINKKLYYENLCRVGVMVSDKLLDSDLQDDGSSLRIIQSRPTDKEYEIIEEFNEKLLSSLDSDKINERVQTALRYNSLYEKSGIRNIDDTAARKALLNYKHNYKGENYDLPNSDAL